MARPPGLYRPPADLTAEHLWAHSDGDLFWYISHGIEMPDAAACQCRVSVAAYRTKPDGT